MDLIKAAITFFLEYGASSIVFSAFIMLVYIVFHLCRLNSVHDYNAGKFALIWAIIVIPQVLFLHVSEAYKQHLPTHELNLTKSGCKQLHYDNSIKGKNCRVVGRITKEQTEHYVLSAVNAVVLIEKCYVANIRHREFFEYSKDFEHLYSTKTINDALFNKH